MSKLQVDDIVNKDDDGSVGFSRGAVVTGGRPGIVIIRYTV